MNKTSRRVEATPERVAKMLEAERRLADRLERELAECRTRITTLEATAARVGSAGAS